jgi:hypothetical protein
MSQPNQTQKSASQTNVPEYQQKLAELRASGASVHT